VAAALGVDVSTEQDDGTFWMSMRDFCNYFANVDVCEYRWGSAAAEDG
jgi:hypothetical protein